MFLRGGRFNGCPKRASARGAVAVAARRRVVRRGGTRTRGGRWHSVGKNSFGSSRTTVWLTVDRCDGTLTKVTEGDVAVRDLRLRKTVLVPAGKSYLARARRR
jgi:hypothetical protein